MGLIEREVRAFVASDTFADVWVRVNTRAQQTLVRVLKVDRTGAVSMQGDQVVLDRAAPLRPDGMTRQLPHEVDHVMVRSTAGSTGRCRVG